jgi:hypothetical protein
MDNSLLISKYIQYILEHSNEIADILDPENAPHDLSSGENTQEYTQRIFPLLQPDTLSFPFIVHSRTGIQVNYTKDIALGLGWTNTVNYTVSCVSDDYVQCIELANAVRHTMEGCTWKKEDIFIHPIQLLTVAEYTTDNDAFVEELQFQMMVE